MFALEQLKVHKFSGMVQGWGEQRESGITELRGVTFRKLVYLIVLIILGM
jgi:hypothetical protein